MYCFSISGPNSLSWHIFVASAYITAVTCETQSDVISCIAPELYVCTIKPIQCIIKYCVYTLFTFHIIVKYIYVCPGLRKG